jgi:hypothetical protein
MFKVTKKAFTALLVGAIMAVMIGAILLIISYTVVGAVLAATPGTGALGAGTTLNASLTANIGNIVQALNIVGISLIVVGIAGIIYMLIGLGGTSAGRR